MQKERWSASSSKRWGHKVSAGPVFVFSTLVLQVHLVEMVPGSRDVALRNKSTFSWNDTLKCEVLEWMFWVCCSVWSSCQKTKANSKHSAYAFHLCKTNTMTNGQLRYQNKFKQNNNRSFKTKQKRGTDVSTRVVREWGNYVETVVN